VVTIKTKSGDVLILKTSPITENKVFEEVSKTLRSSRERALTFYLDENYSMGIVSKTILIEDIKEIVRK
jgi:hypothetical protein